jgi:hypothetical protein
VNIKDTIAALNQIQADGIIRRYAIGGAVGATFYLEPVATVDVDVFVSFQTEAESLLVSLQPIFDYLKARGGVMEGGYIVVAGWPVQFLPTATPLTMGRWSKPWKRMSLGWLPVFSPPNTWPPSRCRPGALKTKPAYSNSPKPARSTPRAFKMLWCVTDSQQPGDGLNNNSWEAKDDF